MKLHRRIEDMQLCSAGPINALSGLFEKKRYWHFVLDALEPVLCSRQPERDGSWIHSDRGSPCVGIRYSERLAEAGIEPSVGSKGGQL